MSSMDGGYTICQQRWVYRIRELYNRDLLRYRVAKMHRIPYLYRSFSAKVTYI